MPDGLFTLGVPPEEYHLPHPRLGLAVVLLIRRVLVRSFEILLERSFSLALMKEDEITAALRGIIESDLRQKGGVSGFSRRTYEVVTRGGQVENYDFTRLCKAPDLCFKLRNDEEEPRPVLSVHDALFVECKPVDKDHGVGSRYCELGLRRFVDGDYAWAMEEGLMLGYARGRTITEDLIPEMQKPSRLEQLKTAELPRPIALAAAAAQDKAEALHLSRHRRGFPWVADKGPATEILIYHSWHECT
ncbi:MAG: hypothetical protein GY722_18675 [bacterium]|nr:hypothetical protein [bacterium]